ncbi:discoidin domain-containing protein [Streptomyces silvisoli]|uniref:Discoidin domain-containing protein n=1 Tax=Streptomyces silvisoli TaxID=3034235 RepID=A0ABT5ZD02_9ACTN|nr:discoidin domain-containing protein [Streptomyces silvisoli]MDF3287701.1 discoidin domain-containing protein [Streptomyces silvisoli]
MSKLPALRARPARLHRYIRPTAPALAALLIAAAPAAQPIATAADRPDTTADSPCTASAPGWTLTSTTIDPKDSYHAFVGNGYLGQRVPATGSGYFASAAKTGWPLYSSRYDGSFVSGLYAHNKQTTSDRQVIAALPTWTGMTVGTGGETFSGNTSTGRISHYRQTLYLRCGLVRTSLTWTASDGRATDLVYDVFTDRADQHVAAVRLRMTPHWSGQATVTDLIDGRGARMLSATATGARPGGRTQRVGFRTDGTGTSGAVASTLSTSADVSRSQFTQTQKNLTGSQTIGFPVRGGQTYTLTKYVGVDTALTSHDPDGSAVAASQQAAARGWAALFTAHSAAWDRLWRSDIEVAGQPQLQSWVRSSEYGLLSSLRAGSANSIAPTGLSSDNYAGLVFWDAETWMFPSLLAYHPDLARSVVDYRYRTLAGARANARQLGYQGVFYPWESGSQGNLQAECQSWSPPHCVTQIHLQSDIALAVWQYYQATGDTAWLRDRGWPVLNGIAQFWAGRATPDSDGSYSIKNVAGPDEYSNGVTDGVFTNAGAATALRNATAAAKLLGHPAPAEWTRIADHLRIPYDPGTHVFQQYAGYKGSLIKQADAVMLMYPLGWPMSSTSAQSTLDYYAARTDPDGPAMTDSIHAIDAAAIGEPGCSTYTYLMRSVEPFVRGPFDEFSEARGSKAGASDPLAGAPAQDFLTGAGGFLQTFANGLGGLRWSQEGVRLDPTLPPQLAKGVTLKGLHWQGRTFDVAIGAHATTVRLTSGRPFDVESAQGRQVVSRSAPAVLKTRRPDLAATTDVARCAKATASSAQPGMYAEAAVDGNTTTAWVPDGTQGTLTVDLGGPVRIASISPRWTATRPAWYGVQVSLDGRHWSARPRGTVSARYVRVTVRAANANSHPGIAELTVRQAD